MKKIIHLSDLHIGFDDCGSRFKTLTDNLTFLKQPAENYVIVITGDLVENANHTEHVDEAVAALEQLESGGYKVLVVPGNHDYGTGSVAKPEFVGSFKTKFLKNEEASWPRLDIIEGVAFIGLDSNAGEIHWNDRFFSQGELGKAQLKELKKIMADPQIDGLKRVVYLHHHPFDFKLGMQLRDKEKLEKIISNKVSVILFGHYHDNTASAGKIYHGIWGINRCYNAGSSTHKKGNAGPHRVIDLTYDDPRMDYDGDFL